MSTTSPAPASAVSGDGLADAFRAAVANRPPAASSSPPQRKGKTDFLKAEPQAPEPRTEGAVVPGVRGSQNWERSLQTRTLSVRQVARVTSGGKIRSTSALVAVGDGNGTIGWGEGRASDILSAIQKAERRARKNLVYVDRFESRTLFGDIDYKFQNTRLMLAPKAAGYGLSVNHVISEICTLCGINDLAGKVMGSTNRMNVVKATFAAFTYQKHPQTLARQRGKKVADVSMRYFGRTGTDVPHRAHLL